MSEFPGNSFGTFNSLSYDPDLGVNGSHDPVALVRASQRTSVNSRRFIERFTALDVEPIEVIDAATQVQRTAQIVRLTRRICGQETQGATDIQVFNLYRTFENGWL
jgi:hypothetical protein